MTRRDKIMCALDIFTYAFLAFLVVNQARKLVADEGPITLGVLLVVSVGLYLLVDYTHLQYQRWQHGRGRKKCEHERALQEALYVLECHVDRDLGPCKLTFFGECDAHWPVDAFGQCAHPQAVALLDRYPVEAVPDVQPKHAHARGPAPVGPGGEGAEEVARGAGQAEALTRRTWSGTLGMVDTVSVDRRTLVRPDQFQILTRQDRPLYLTARGSGGDVQVVGTVLGASVLHKRIRAHGEVHVDVLEAHAPELLADLVRGEDVAVGLEVRIVDGDYEYDEEGSLTIRRWMVGGAMVGNAKAAWPEAKIHFDPQEDER